MSDDEMINLIDHYRWNIKFDGSFVVITGENNIFTLSFQGKLRGAIKSALDMQFKWSVG